MSSKAHASHRARGARGKRLGFWALIALALHLEAGVALLLLSYFYAPRNAEVEARRAEEGESVEIGMLDEDAAREILAELERADEERREEEIKKEVEAKKAPGQVVELPKPRNQERPKDAKFAAEYDSTVEKETKKFGELKANARMSATGQAEETSTASPPSQAQPQVAPQAGAKSPALAMRTPQPPGAAERARQLPGLGPRNLTGPNPETEAGPPDGDGREMATGRAPAEQPTAGAAPGRVGQAGAPSLLPSLDQVASAIGSGTQDHLDDVDEGAETALNAKKWKFASFFNRVKRQVRDHWRPAEEYRKRDPTFRIYGMRDRFTLLKVELKSDGSLASVGLDTPSGIDFLDDVAVEAFKQAQPFPNPPRQLVEEGSGLITFRFGFYFEIGGGGASPRMKVFRYDNY